MFASNTPKTSGVLSVISGSGNEDAPNNKYDIRISVSNQQEPNTYFVSKHGSKMDKNVKLSNMDINNDAIPENDTINSPKVSRDFASATTGLENNFEPFEPSSQA